MLAAVTEVDEQEEKTDADVSGARKLDDKVEQEWGEDDATEVDARPPEEPPAQPRKPR